MKNRNHCCILYSLLILLLPILSWADGDESKLVFYNHIHALFSENWNVDRDATETYGDNCVLLKQEKQGNEEKNLLAIVCQETDIDLGDIESNYGFKSHGSAWEIIGSMDTIKGAVEKFRESLLVEGAVSCGYSDEYGIHSAGLCYKSFVRKNDTNYFVFSTGSKGLEFFKEYQIVARSLLTSRTQRDGCCRSVRPILKQQPFSLESLEPLGKR